MKAKAETDPGLELYGTAQTRGYAAKHVVALGDAIGTSVKTNRGIGNEAVYWPNRSSYKPISPTDGGGHGDSIDFMLIDEGWAIQSHVIGGVRPAMIARPHSQLLVISTMGTVDSTVWNGWVARGRDSTETPDSDLAYIEYSAPSEDAVMDSKQWEDWMPALGHTVDNRGIQSAIDDMLADPNEGPSGVIRAFGNLTTRSLVSLFPDEWLTAAWVVMDPPTTMALAVDVNDNPAGASIASGHLTTEGKTAGRVIEWRFGSPNWVPDSVDELCQARQVEAIVADFGGPARQLQAQLAKVADGRNIPLVDRRPRDFAADTGNYYDGLRTGSIVMEKIPELEAAVEGAVRKSLGEGLWVITRKPMTVDASPLISVILALGLAAELAIRPKVKGFVL
jgi:hypothetical protein